MLGWVLVWPAGAAERPDTGEGLLGAIRSVPLASTPAGPEGVRFERLGSERTGLDFVHRWTAAARYERLFNSSMVGGGVAVGDYDGDGRLDLALTRPAGGLQVYRNLGGWRFTNVTELAGVREAGAWTSGVTWVDLDGDGHLDLYVCVYDGPNRLYRNRGNGSFAEEGRAWGLDFRGASVMAAFGDYDRDGDLDVYLLTAGLMPNASQRFRVKFVEGRPVVPEELQEFWQLIYQPGERAAVAEAGQLDRLYRNNGDGTFTDVSQAAGIMGCDFGNAVLWWDYNHDGWPDLYVANDYFGPDRLYRNNADGTFTDLTREALPYTPWTSMGADLGDLNNDGWMDLIASDMSGTTHQKRMVALGDQERSGWFLDLAEPRQYLRNALYLNSGRGRFLEVAHLAGLAHTDWTWSIRLADLDDDGWLDVFVPNGMTRDWMDNDLAAQAKELSPAEFVRFWRAQPVRRDENLVFRGRNGLEFEEVGRVWGLSHPGPSFGAVTADLDGDGRLDVVVNDFDAPVRVYRNAGRTGNRVVVRLEGRGRNRQGLGATVRVETATGIQQRYVTLSRGFMSAEAAVAHFGLGEAGVIRRLEVEWPCGQVQALADLAVNRSYVVSGPPAGAGTEGRRGVASGWLVRADVFDGHRHVAAVEDDFRQQPLLPFRLSGLGPGQAWADVDGDGREDLYLGGTALQPGGLWRNEGEGRFRLDPGAGIAGGIEEMAPLFFEADGDGFPDLYLVHGGNDAALAAATGGRADRLYLNDGRGRFRSAPPGAWPAMPHSGSVAVAADWDRDGDLDLFVGSRHWPGRYPRSPESALLRNDGGRFQDVTDAVAPGLRRSGMVTGAVWSDADGDGWVDLLVTCDWGPVRLFRNEAGRLRERTLEAGLAERTGWWSGITAADVDEDGHMDYVATNFGRNSRYQASAAAPLRIYHGDFEGRGEMQILEAQVTAAGILPVRGRSALAAVLPGMGARFPTHRAFAEATLPELIGEAALAAAFQVEVNTLETGWWENDGEGRFTFRALPLLAQAAPAWGAVMMDVDGNGADDLCLAQNAFSPQRETGRAAGGVSLVLLGKGRGAFQPVWPDRSGWAVSGDAKSLTRADVDGDGRPDLVVGVNDGEWQAWVNRAAPAPRFLSVQLEGPRGNPTAVGARVTVGWAGGRQRVAEVHAGSGYLSQSSSTLVFGLGEHGRPERFEVRWPDGRRTEHPGEGSALRVRLQAE